MTLLLSALRAYNCRCLKTTVNKFSVLSISNRCIYPKNLLNGSAKESLLFSSAKLESYSKYSLRTLGTFNNQIQLCAKLDIVSSSISQRSFHTSQPRKALPPAVWLILRPVMNIAAFLFGRTIKKWWQKLPQERRTKLLNKLKKYKFHILGFVSSCALGLMWFFITHLEKHPLTQRNRLILFSQKDMHNICQTVEDGIVELSKADILPATDFLYRRVERVMRRIMEANGEDILKSGVHKWKIYVFNDRDTKNAMVLPNGTVFIFSGIMNICSTDDELGAVLSHEIAHTLLNHQGEMMSRQHFFDALLMLLIILLWAVLPDAAALASQIFATKATEILIHLPFSRQMESEADSVGLKMAAKACFDVRAASAFWAKMAMIGDIQGEEVPDEFLSTHPAHETRQKQLDELIPDALRLRDSCKCPSLGASDPRQVIDLWKKQFESLQPKESKGVLISIHAK